MAVWRDYRADWYADLVTPRRFPPPWSAEETDACFIVGDHSAYVKFSDTGKSNAPGPGGHKDEDSPTHTRR